MYTPSQSEYEVCDGSHTRHHVVVRAVFDHDWEQHLLVQQCSTGAVATMLGMDAWEFALYLVSSGDVIHLHTFFDAERCPFAEAAQMVECWERTGHYGGVLNGVESDSFD